MCLIFKVISFITIILLLINTISLVEAVSSEPVMISKSEKAEEIIFDGKWTFTTEWKPTSLNKISSQTIIRSTHYENNIYLLIDVLEDESIDLYNDKATVCFDTTNNKSKIPDKDDYCFTSILGSSKGITLQGNLQINEKDQFKEILNHEEFIAIGAVSDENDRYSKTPHASYEFRIPTDIVGRSDNYGFLVYVIDTNQNKPITWPEEIIIEKDYLPNPSKWGNLISPDKSLPEFHSVMILFTILFGLLSLIKLKPFFGNLFHKSV